MAVVTDKNDRVKELRMGRVLKARKLETKTGKVNVLFAYQK